MWFPSSDIFLKIQFVYSNNKFLIPNFYTQSKNSIEFDQTFHELKQNLKIKIKVPELLYIEFKNVSYNIKINSIQIDDIPVEDENFDKVCKFSPNPTGLTVEKINILPKKISKTIYTNGFLIFDLFETNAISYLLSINNKINF